MLVSLCISFVWYELNIFVWKFRLIWILCGATFTPDQRFYIFVISKPFEFWDTFFFAIVCLNLYAFLSTRKMFSMLVQLIACDALATLFIRRIYTWFEKNETKFICISFSTVICFINTIIYRNFCDGLREKKRNSNKIKKTTRKKVRWRFVFELFNRNHVRVPMLVWYWFWGAFF